MAERHLTKEEKSYIRTWHYSKTPVEIARHLKKSESCVYRFLKKSRLTTFVEKGKPRLAINEVKSTRHRTVFEFWVEGVLLDEIKNYNGLSDFKVINKIREKYAELVLAKTFTIYKRVESKFPTVDRDSFGVVKHIPNLKRAQ